MHDIHRACHPGGPYCDNYPGALSLIQAEMSSKSCILLNFIHYNGYTDTAILDSANKRYSSGE